jgi:hypothetical protein
MSNLVNLDFSADQCQRIHADNLVPQCLVLPSLMGDTHAAEGVAGSGESRSSHLWVKEPVAQTIQIRARETPTPRYCGSFSKSNLPGSWLENDLISRILVDAEGKFPSPLARGGPTENCSLLLSKLRRSSPWSFRKQFRDRRARCQRQLIMSLRFEELILHCSFLLSTSIPYSFCLASPMKPKRSRKITPSGLWPLGLWRMMNPRTQS